MLVAGTLPREAARRVFQVDHIGVRILSRASNRGEQKCAQRPHDNQPGSFESKAPGLVVMIRISVSIRTRHREREGGAG
jgi:hypothetical protein